MTQARPRVALFVTCLVDLYRPSVGFAAIKLLEEAGCQVEVPPSQTCCGQPAYNSGDRANAKALARAVVDAFQGYDYVVAPSGSCAGMIAHHYPALFDDDPHYRGKSEALAARTHELVSFLTDVMGMEKVAARLDGSVTYHDSCSGLREMGVKAQPRKLLKTVEGLSLIELAEPEICCGFGGTFCVKYPDISVRMVTDKCRDIQATGAGTLLAGDMGCLLNMAGRLKREGASVKVRHVAEVLAGMTRDAAPIGDAKKD
jgi:L-lactate dehydrogenase complex protein LldE